MAESIKVTLSPDKLKVAPGESVETTVAIQNISDVVDVYSIELEGIDPQWCTLSLSSVSLFPGDQDQVQITIHPPRASVSKAGPYDVLVKATSRKDPAVGAAAPLAVEIEPFLSFDLDLSPKMMKSRKGSYRVILTNLGNATTTFKLEGQDPEEICQYQFTPDRITVEPGETAQVPLTISPKKKPFTGSSKTHGFTITATPVADEPSAEQ